ncbi:MAG: hypothetical protein OSJ68_05355 [Clostridia bacterium]|nr:hypothetical protein [Clostridia bacterium]
MTQKEKAVEQLMLLGINEIFVESFRDYGNVVLFDGFVADTPEMYPDVQEKIKEIEKQYGCLVYAVTHERFVFGDCYSFLIVSKYEEDWKYCLRRIDTDTYSTSAYVWNKTKEHCSEFGYITVLSCFGGILRVS